MYYIPNCSLYGDDPKRRELIYLNIFTILTLDAMALNEVFYYFFIHEHGRFERVQTVNNF
jgi:hypothetical protein